MPRRCQSNQRGQNLRRGPGEEASRRTPSGSRSSRGHRKSASRLARGPSVESSASKLAEAAPSLLANGGQEKSEKQRRQRAGIERSSRRRRKGRRGSPN